MKLPFGQPNSLSRGAAPRGLGGAAPVPVGRSRFDVNRMAEQMVRRRDPRGAQFLFGQAMQKDGQAFQREMFGVQQEAEGRRDTRNFDQGVEMFGMQQEAEGERDARNFDQSVQMFGMQQQAGDQRYDRERKDQLTDEQRKLESARQTYPIFDPLTGQPSKNHFMTGNGMVLPGERPEPKPSVQQIPGTGDYVPMFGNQQVSGAPLYQEQPGWSVKGTPKLAPKTDAKAEKPVITWNEDPKTAMRVPYQQIVNPETGEVTLRRVTIIDENNDGVDDRQQGAPAGGAKAPGQTASGNTWKPKTK